MDITPYIWGIVFVVAAIILGLSVAKARQFLLETFPAQPNGIKIIYLSANDTQHQIKIDIKNVFWRKDSFDNKHLMFEAIDTQGLQHVLTAERILAAYTTDGRILPNIHQYLVQLRRRDLLLGWLPSA